MILGLRTDSYDAELYINEGNNVLETKKWNPGRELSVQLLDEIRALCGKNRSTIYELQGIVVYEGPGSFTGLRIGVSVANALGYGLQVPVVSETGDDWLEKGLERLQNTKKFTPAQPMYGADPHITQPKK